MDSCLNILWFIYLLCLALFVGKIATFSFLMAPIVHRLLEKDQAAKLLGVFFPRYYKLGILCAIVGLVTSLEIAFKLDLPRVRYWTVIWAAILFTEVFVLKFLVPTIGASREGRWAGDAAATKKWEFAHKLSVRINVLNLLAGLALIGLFWR